MQSCFILCQAVAAAMKDLVVVSNGYQVHRLYQAAASKKDLLVWAS